MNTSGKFYGLLYLLTILSFSVPKNKAHFIVLSLTDQSEIKAIPQIIFYTDTFNSSGGSMFMKHFKIKKTEFRKIENIIIKNASYEIIDSLAERYFDFNIIKNEINKIFGTVNRNKTIPILKLILEELKNAEAYPEIEKNFNYLYSKLPRRGG